MLEKYHPREREATLRIITEYLSSLGADLAFQHIDKELSDFPGPYAEPRGCFLVAKAEGEIVGCVGLKPLAEDICEMKRLYVRDSHRGQGIGRLLALAIFEEARNRGYAFMKLDTLARLEAARRLYSELGFHETDPYVENPLEGALFLEKDLSRP